MGQALYVLDFVVRCQDGCFADSRKRKFAKSRQSHLLVGTRAAGRLWQERWRQRLMKLITVGVY